MSKAIKNVKICLFVRSPGGTPLRTGKPKPADNQDPAALIAEALKRKFASRVLHSPHTPDTDQEYDGSPDSPVAPVSVNVHPVSSVTFPCLAIILQML